MMNLESPANYPLKIPTGCHWSSGWYIFTNALQNYRSFRLNLWNT